ncbi:MAG: DUF560 domain-containing protein [Pseudomonadaceae bacterium]|nr:DUF560 domain-containing protein [Pseudomonadaceae bacterium]
MKKINNLKVKQLFLLSVLLFASYLSYASLKDMEQLVTEHKFQEAYLLGSNLLAEEAGNPNFDMLYGMAALRVEQYEQALFAFERVLMFNSSAAVPRFELARTHYMLDNLKSARHHFNLVLESSPQPPLAIQTRIQWYLATMDAKEAGKAIAATSSNLSSSVNHFYLGARFGYDSNPRNMTHLDVFHPLFGLDPLNLPAVDSDTFHELNLGANRLQQQSERWGWFASGNASLRGYHNDQKNMDNYSLGLQAGGILLGSNWRLSVPLQVNKQVRDDKNEVLVLAVAADFNQRLTNKANYSFFGQLADIGNKSSSNETNITSYTLGATFSYRFNESLRLHAGPLLTTENPDSKTGDYNGRNLYGIRSGIGYSFNAKQQLEFNFSYLNAKHKADDPSFLKQRRKDDQLSVGLKFSQRFSNDLLIDLGIQQNNNSSTLNLYSYHRTQLSAGIRKEW